MGKLKFLLLKLVVAYKAKRAGICQEWHQGILTAKSLEELLDMYIKGIDFCIRTEFMTAEDISRYASDVAPVKGIYTEGEVELLDDSRRYVVLMGDARAKASYKGHAVVSIYIKDSSELNLTASGHAFVAVHLMGSARILVKTSGEAKVALFQDGGNVLEMHSTDESIIKIKDRRNG